MYCSKILKENEDLMLHDEKKPLIVGTKNLYEITTNCQHMTLNTEANMKCTVFQHNK
jgi:hypothetical protein